MTAGDAATIDFGYVFGARGLEDSSAWGQASRLCLQGRASGPSSGLRSGRRGQASVYSPLWRQSVWVRAWGQASRLCLQGRASLGLGSCWAWGQAFGLWSAVSIEQYCVSGRQRSKRASERNCFPGRPLWIQAFMRARFGCRHLQKFISSCAAASGVSRCARRPDGPIGSGCQPLRLILRKLECGDHLSGQML